MVDTVAAVSTPLGEGAIAIVRLSGPRARAILEEIFVPARAGRLRPHQLRLGWVVDPRTGRKLDQVLATWMPPGRSYTAEEMAEINCHGGVAAVRGVLRLVLDRGARLARPGEFTLRAFLNGRLALTEAEAVLDVVRAPGEAGLEAALRQLGGELTRRAEEAYTAVRAIVAEVEAGLDFPEEVGEPDRVRLAEAVGAVAGGLRELLAGAEQGRVVREGLRVVLVGRPNAGKSSLMNALLGQQRAIVTAVPGTTRDVLEEVAEWRGLPVRLCDTAGLAEPKDEAEAVALARAHEAVARADVTLLVVDGSAADGSGWPEAVRLAAERTVVVISKGDLLTAEERRLAGSRYPGWRTVLTSAKEGWGLDELREAVLELVAERGIRPGESALVTRERQRRLLEGAHEALLAAREGLREGLPMDCVAVPLAEAGEALGELLGRNVREEVLEAIFSEFCVGK